MTQKNAPPTPVLVPALVSIGLLLVSSAAQAQMRAEPFEEQSPVVSGLPDLEELNDRLIEITPNCQAATVAMLPGGNGGKGAGSGVIVSEAGLIFTAAHVLAALGDEIDIIMSDGTQLTARPLGSDFRNDSAMAQIIEEGQYPFVELGDSRDVKGNQWCIALGHPGGYDPGRTPPIRLGRFLSKGTCFVTDTAVAPGDSGGSLFDLTGHLIGIHSNIGGSLSLNRHVPIDSFLLEWGPLLAGENQGNPDRLFGEEGKDLDKEGTDEEPDEEAFAQLRERMLEAIRAGEDVTMTPDDLRSLGGPAGLRKLMQEVRALTPGELRAYEKRSREERARRRAEAEAEGEPDLASVDPFFASVMEALTPVTEREKKATVQVISEGDEACLGTVVSRDGHFLTKATETGGGEVAIIINGEEYEATRVARFREHDLALYQTDAPDLRPVRWAPDGGDAPLGALLSSVAPDGSPLGVGLVSVLPRKLKGRGFLGVGMEEVDDGLRVTRVVPGSAAKDAGFREGDIITQVDGEDIVNQMEFTKKIMAAGVNSALVLTYLRGDAERGVRVTLRERADSVGGGAASRLTGPLSERRSGFPLVLQHDIPLHPSLCGGPIIDLDGRCLGINTGRIDRISTYAIPASVARQLVIDALADIEEKEGAEEEAEPETVEEIM